MKYIDEGGDTSFIYRPSAEEGMEPLLPETNLGTVAPQEVPYVNGTMPRQGGTFSLPESQMDAISAPGGAFAQVQPNLPAKASAPVTERSMADAISGLLKLPADVQTQANVEAARQAYYNYLTVSSTSPGAKAAAYDKAVKLLCESANAALENPSLDAGTRAALEGLLEEIDSASGMGDNITQENEENRLYSITIPSVRNGEFEKWFDSLANKEFNGFWANPELKEIIKDRLRAPGGLHEWHLVSRADVFKRWGVTAEEIREMRTLIEDVRFVNPPGIHGGRGSTRAHNELLEIIDSSNTYTEFKTRLREWAARRLEGGVEALSPGLRD